MARLSFFIRLSQFYKIFHKYPRVWAIIFSRNLIHFPLTGSCPPFDYTLMFNEIQSYHLAGCCPPLRSKLPRRTPRCRYWRGKLCCCAFQVDGDGGDIDGNDDHDLLALARDIVLTHLSGLRLPKFTFFAPVLVSSSSLKSLQLHSEIISLQGSGREVAPGMPSFSPLLLRIWVDHQNTRILEH